MYKKISILLLGIIAIMNKPAFSQQTEVYPKVMGYFSVTQPFATLVNGTFTSNFGNVYDVSFPFGLNLLKSDKFGFSFEVSPTIRTEKNISKISTISFQPGAMFRYGHGFTLITRLAFETSGRYGFTPVFNKVIHHGKDCNIFAAVPFPVRIGNAQPWSISSGLQLGVSF